MCISYLGELTLRYKSYHLKRVKHFSLKAISYKSDRLRDCFCLFRLFWFSFFFLVLGPSRGHHNFEILFESWDLLHWG